MSKISVLRSLGILFVSSLCLAACTPEEYGPCSIPPTKAYINVCASQGKMATATCAADYVFDCDSLICGIYESSSPFCTHRCVPTLAECKAAGHDDDYCTKYRSCPEGYSCQNEGECPEEADCVEWVKGTAAFYCLPKDKRFSTVAE